MELIAKVARKLLVCERGGIDLQTADNRRRRHKQISDYSSSCFISLLSTSRHEHIFPFIETVLAREFWEPLEHPLLCGHRAFVQNVQHVLLDRSVLVQRGIHAFADVHLLVLRGLLQIEDLLKKERKPGDFFASQKRRRQLDEFWNGCSVND